MWSARCQVSQSRWVQGSQIHHTSSLGPEPGFGDSTTNKSQFLESSVFIYVDIYVGLPLWLSGQESACPCKRYGFDPQVRKLPLEEETATHSVFLPGESHGQRSLVGCSPRGRKESGTTECSTWTPAAWPYLAKGESREGPAGDLHPQNRHQMKMLQIVPEWTVLTARAAHHSLFQAPRRLGLTFIHQCICLQTCFFHLVVR